MSNGRVVELVPRRDKPTAPATADGLRQVLEALDIEVRFNQRLWQVEHRCSDGVWERFTPRSEARLKERIAEDFDEAPNGPRAKGRLMFTVLCPRPSASSVVRRVRSVVIPCGGEGPTNLGLVLLPASGSRGPWCCRHSLSSVAVACHGAALLLLCESPSVEIAQTQQRTPRASTRGSTPIPSQSSPKRGTLVMSVPAGVAARAAVAAGRAGVAAELPHPVHALAGATRPSVGDGGARARQGLRRRLEAGAARGRRRRQPTPGSTSNERRRGRRAGIGFRRPDRRRDRTGCEHSHPAAQQPPAPNPPST